MKKTSFLLRAGNMFGRNIFHESIDFSHKLIVIITWYIIAVLLRQSYSAPINFRLATFIGGNLWIELNQLMRLNLEKTLDTRQKYYRATFTLLLLIDDVEKSVSRQSLL